MITHLSVILTGYDIGIHAKTTSIKRDSYNNQVNTYHIEIDFNENLQSYPFVTIESLRWWLDGDIGKDFQFRCISVIWKRLFC